MNYADQAAELWKQREILEIHINEMTAYNKEIAQARWDRLSETARKMVNKSQWLAREIGVINEKDLVRAGMIDDDKFARDKANTLALLALVHGHKPTKGQP